MGMRREHSPLFGPHPVTMDDVPSLNDLFSSAFTARYRRDGLVGVRVPPLNPAIWEYAISAAGRGAMLWRDSHGAIAAFNFAHTSGREGWMGPLAVREDCQGTGVGKLVVRSAISHLMGSGCATIGLETMPRTVDNIGFYSTLGFVPGTITVTLTMEATESGEVRGLLSQLNPAARDAAVAECSALTARVLPGSEYAREVRLTHELRLGDTILLRRDDALVAFALCHASPLVEGRGREELRVLKLVAADQAAFEALLAPLASLARRTSNARFAMRVQGEYRAAYASVIRAGGRVRWTDLRMTLEGYPQVPPVGGIAFTNWEI
ncbi:MAG: GNAT family N-acetyltransferase [Gemmatimonadaceae bacterium]|nr:GNAT family N-acetyltransferase [Gemmatimonadaceae bacterium]